MNALYKKNELTFSLVCIGLYVVLMSAADGLSASMGIEKGVTAVMALLMALVLFFFIRKNNLMEKYGLCPFKGNARAYLYFLPLAVMLSMNLWKGFHAESSGLESVLFVISMLCVGFLEEVIFRGLLLKAMMKSNVKAAVIVSSLTFGFGHIINLISGAPFVPTLLQVCYAAAAGFMFTVLFLKGKSLLPCIAVHGLFNALSLFGYAETSMLFDVFSAVVLCVINLGYAWWIVKKVKAQ